jgi:2-oxoglutarate dehydrogenase E2 component (dihydrolipoamide succinyltransferase)
LIAHMSINIVVPEVGESIVDARVARWLKKEGDAVAAGEPLVELETDKVDVEVSAPRNGVLGKIAHGDGADVKIGDVLGTIEEGRSTESTERRAEPRKRAEARRSAEPRNRPEPPRNPRPRPRTAKVWLPPRRRRPVNWRANRRSI